MKNNNKAKSTHKLYITKLSPAHGSHVHRGSKMSQRLDPPLNSSGTDADENHAQNNIIPVYNPFYYINKQQIISTFQTNNL